MFLTDNKDLIDKNNISVIPASYCFEVFLNQKTDQNMFFPDLSMKSFKYSLCQITQTHLPNAKYLQQHRGTYFAFVEFKFLPSWSSKEWHRVLLAVVSLDCLLGWVCVHLGILEKTEFLVPLWSLLISYRKPAPIWDMHHHVCVLLFATIFFSH